jgi:5-methylcytosine-specific restriction endonuclease McrA
LRPVRSSLLTAGKPEAQRHLVASIENPIDEETVLRSFASADREELERIREEGNGFYAWGAVPGLRNIPNWKAMERGDYVLCVYGNTYYYVARVLEKYDNERFARRVWGEDEDGETWEYMYFLTQPIEVDRPLHEFEGYLRGRYWGFTRISNLELEEIEEGFSSVEGLIREILDYQGEGLPDELTLRHNRSAEIAEDSLQVDAVTHGNVDEDSVPDSEGRKRIIQHVQYERSQKNRRIALEKHGATCAVCTFNFDETYGKDYADGYIQIHHIKPVSEYEGEVDPNTDLVPLCANCHAMAHRRRAIVTSIDDLKALIEKANG